MVKEEVPCLWLKETKALVEVLKSVAVQTVKCGHLHKGGAASAMVTDAVAGGDKV